MEGLVIKIKYILTKNTMGGGVYSSRPCSRRPGGPLRTRNRNNPEGGIRPTLNIKNLGFSKV